MKQFLEAGKIVGTHGIRGEMRVDVWCDSPEFFCQLKTVYLNEGKTPIKVKSRPHKNIALVKAQGVETIDDAEKLRGKILYMNRNDVSLEDGEFFIQDLIGLEVYDIDTNIMYGKITDVFPTGANDVYQITDDNKKDYLIPVIDDVVISIEPENGKVLIKPLKGIFDDED